MSRIVPLLLLTSWFAASTPAEEPARSWAFAPLTRPDLPEGLGDSCAHPIDRFIRAELYTRGLGPSKPADRRTLIRRLYFDLIGLPPSGDAIRSFVIDSRSDAYDRLVDRLLASPRYGERWATHWLDVAHYADTHGFERDRKRDHAFEYRDWVIRALNSDMPYDEFLRRQIAGDVLAPEDPDSVVATGFLAAGPYDFVGQEETKNPVLNRAARADDLDDIVTTVMTSTIALTVQCARCHDHKIDPIPQSDYYKLWSVFSGVRRGDRDASATQRAELEHDRHQLTSSIRELSVQIGVLRRQPIDLCDVVSGGSGFGGGTKKHAVDPRSGRTTSSREGGLKGVQHNRFVAAEHPWIDGLFVPDGKESAVVTSTGIELDDLRPSSGSVWDFVSNGASLGFTTTKVGDVDYAEGDHTLLGLHANKGITFDLAAIRESTGYGIFRFSAAVGHGGALGQSVATFRAYVDGKRRFSKERMRAQEKGVRVDIELAESERFLTLVALDGGDGYSHDQIFLGDARWTPDGSPRVGTGVTKLEENRATLQARLRARTGIRRVYAVVSGKPTPVRILDRGNPETPTRTVGPGSLMAVDTLSSTFTPTEDEGQRRLALARWITDPRNPLTARVWVNRLWHHHFGRGIVATPSDFGMRGQLPTHPELLDWLSSELIDSGWSTKAIHRLIVTSETYRQASADLEEGERTRQARAVDSSNRFLWRMNPRRLETEALRDSILTATGSLQTTMYGPGYQAFRYEEEYAPEYHALSEDRPEWWRRTVYRFVVRSTPDPFLSRLGCPDPSTWTPARRPSTTAIQALALLNNGFVLGQSKRFAERLLREEPLAERRIERAFWLALQRRVTKEEAVGATELVDAAGLAALCRALLNSSEFSWVD